MKVTIVVWIACLIAGLRILTYSSAFPFFSDNDEWSHFEVVLRFARGDTRPQMAPFSEEGAEYLSLYYSPEYRFGPDHYQDKKTPSPLWDRPRDRASAAFKKGVSLWQQLPDQEGTGPPLYYGLAGLWLKIGEVLGLGGLDLLYWTRFLNIFSGAGLVWVGYWAARLTFPAASFPRLAVAVLLAFFPQDTFYAIQSDTLSPVLFGLGFVGLIKFWLEETPSLRVAALTGLALGGACLVKAMVNLPFLAAAGVAMVVRAWQLAKAGKLAAAMPAFAVLGLCALAPLGGWMLRNHYYLGDWMGTTERFRVTGWTHKPLSQWWPHPLFTLDGQIKFWRELTASFWRGEFRWQGRLLAARWADLFYCLSSLVLVAVNLPALLRRNSGLTDEQRAVLWTALGVLLAGIASEALSSMAFDFGGWDYPSRADPIYRSGRLISAALVPFLLLYAWGLECLLGWRGNRWARPAALAAIVLIINISEIEVNRPVFGSLYNLFHRVPFKEQVANIPSLYLHP